MYRVTGDKRTSHHSWHMVLLFIIAANLPDLDFLPGFLIGKPSEFHHGIVHSFGFSALFGLMISLSMYFYSKEREGFLTSFVVFFGVCFSHVVLDCLTYDTSLRSGMPVWWPISDEAYIAPISVFYNITKAYSSELFFPSLFNLHNLMAVVLELLIFLPIIFLTFFIKHRSARPESPYSSYSRS